MNKFTLYPLTKNGKRIEDKRFGLDTVEQIATHFSVLISSVHHHLERNKVGGLTFKNHQIVDNTSIVEKKRLEEATDKIREEAYTQALADLKAEQDAPKKRGRPKIAKDEAEAPISE